MKLRVVDCRNYDAKNDYCSLVGEWDCYGCYDCLNALPMQHDEFTRKLKSCPTTEMYSVVSLLLNNGLAISGAEARRLINAGAVKVNGKVAAMHEELMCPIYIEVGKHKQCIIK